MPQVVYADGRAVKNFSYTKSGKRAARRFARKVRGKVVYSKHWKW